MARVAVIGAGPAGTAIALFAARRGHTVVVVDRDKAPAADGPGAPPWPERSVPQAAQGHTFLGLATRILRDEAGDVVTALAAAGAHESPLLHHPHESNLLVRRLVFEQTFRRVATREPGVTMLDGVLATGLLTRGDVDGIPRVAAVATAEGTIDADVVVDACGGRPPSLAALRQAGIRAPCRSRHAPRFVYMTRRYRLRRGRRFPAVDVPLLATLDYVTVLAFPEDRGHCQLTVVLAAEDPCRRRLRDGDVFDRFLSCVPFAEPWLTSAEAVSAPESVAGVHNRWYRLVDRRGPVVAGLVLIGDAAMQTNPTAARGSRWLWATHSASRRQSNG